MRSHATRLFLSDGQRHFGFALISARAVFFHCDDGAGDGTEYISCNVYSSIEYFSSIKKMEFIQTIVPQNSCELLWLGPIYLWLLNWALWGAKSNEAICCMKEERKKKKKQPNSCVGFSAVLSTGFHFVDSVRWLCTVRALPDSGSVFQLAGIEKFTVRETEMCLFSSSSVAI